MDKVKIKRAKRNKKKLSFKEKALAGVGLTSTLVGGVAGVSRGMQEQRMVSTIKDMLTSGKKKSNTQKAKEALSKVFGIKEAQATSASINFRNLTSGNNSEVRVGESVQIDLTGPAGSVVFYDGGKNGESNRIYLTNTSGEQIHIGEDGTLRQTITMTSDWVGSWTQDWKLFTPSEEEVYAGNVSFSVLSTSTQNPGSNTANPTRIITSENSFDLKVGESKTSRVWVDYDDNTQDSEFNVETSNPNVVNFVLNSDGSFTMRAISAGQASIIVNAKKDPSKGIRIPVRVSEESAQVDLFRVTQNGADVSYVSLNANSSATISAVANLSDGSRSPIVDVSVIDNNGSINQNSYVYASANNNGLVTIQAGDPFSHLPPEEVNQNSNYSVQLVLHPRLAGSNTSLDKTITVSISPRQDINQRGYETEKVAEMPEYIRYLVAEAQAESISQGQRQEIVSYMQSNPKTPPPQSFVPGSWLSYALGVGKEAPSMENGNEVRALLFGYKFENGRYELKYQIAWGIVERTQGAYPEVTLMKGLSYGAIVGTLSVLVATAVLSSSAITVGVSGIFTMTVTGAMAGPIGAAIGAAVAVIIIGYRAIGSDPRKAGDTRIADQFMRQIRDIVDAYNRNRPTSLEEDNWNYDKSTELLGELMKVMSSNFALNTSTNSQRAYFDQMLASMTQTLNTRRQNYANELANLEVYVARDGKRLAYINAFYGNVVIHPNGEAYSEKLAEVPPSVIDAIKNNANPRQVEAIGEDYRPVNVGSIGLPSSPAVIYEKAGQRLLSSLSDSDIEQLTQYFTANPGVFPSEFIEGSFVAEILGLNDDPSDGGNKVVAMLFGYEYKGGRYENIFKIPGTNSVNMFEMGGGVNSVLYGGMAGAQAGINIGSMLSTAMSRTSITLDITSAIREGLVPSINQVFVRNGTSLANAILRDPAYFSNLARWSGNNLQIHQDNLHHLFGIKNIGNGEFEVSSTGARSLGRNFNLMKLKGFFKDLIKPTSANIANWSVIAVTLILGFIHNHRMNLQLRSSDSRLAEEAFSKIVKIVDAYNTYGFSDIDREAKYKDQVIQTITHIFNVYAEQFQLQDRSYNSQKAYLDQMIASINQTYYQRQSGWNQGIRNIEAFEDPQGNREAYINSHFDIVAVYKDGRVISKNFKEVGPSVIDAVKNASNVRRVERLSFDPFIADMTDPENPPPPVISPPVTPPPIIEDTTIYDVYLTDNGKIVWVPEFGLIIIASDGIFKADDNGNKIPSQRLANFPQSLLNAINRTNNRIEDFRTPPPPNQNPPPVVPPPVVPPAIVTPTLSFRNTSTSANLGLGASANNLVRVGEQWEIGITGQEGQLVTAIGGRKTSTGFPNVLHNLGTIPNGQNARLNLSGSFASEDIGEWQMEIKVGDRTAGSLHFTIQAQTQYASINIDTDQSLPAVVVGTAYNQTLQASGGTGPYRWAMTMGNLPSGLTLSTDGKLTGTPVIAGEYNFLLSATDQVGNTTTKSFSLTVNPFTQGQGGGGGQGGGSQGNQGGQGNVIQTPVVNNASIVLTGNNLTLTVNGANFNTNPVANVIMLNNLALTATGGNANMLTAILPANLPAGNYQVFVLNSADASKVSVPVSVSVPPPVQTSGNNNLNNSNQNNSPLGIPSSLESYVLRKLGKSKSYSKFKTWANSTTGKATYAISGKNPTTGESFKFSVTKQQAKNIITRISAMNL